MHLETFDTGRFAPLGPGHPTVVENRIEQAFLAQQPNRAHAAIENIINQPDLPGVLFPESKPAPKPAPQVQPPVAEREPKPEVEEPVTVERPKTEEKKKRRDIATRRSDKDEIMAQGRSSERRDSPKRDRTSQRKQTVVTNRRTYREPDGDRKFAMFWPFKSYKKSARIPEGVNINDKGYKAVHKAALKHGVDVNFALRVAKQESRGNCNATSHANAKGVMQVIPGTARKHGVTRASTLYNCTIGADVGVRELKSCLQKARGNRVQALVCYNAGPAWITSIRYRGRRIPAETRQYIKKITGKTVAKVT